jgi:integrase
LSAAARTTTPARCRCTQRPPKRSQPTPISKRHPHPRAPSFFISIAGTRLDYSTVWNEFDRLRRQTGLDQSPRTRPARIHDLRHSFVLRTLLNWYRAGSDIEAQLPLLSTLLGHVDPASTYWYFEAAPELLTLAADRLEQARGELR